MIDFDRKPSPKSDAEKQFDELNEKYVEKFGKPYVFSIGVDFQTWEEVLKDIRRRIETGEPQPEPDYESGNVY